MGFTEMVIEQALSTSPFGTRIPDISRKDFYLLEEFTQAIKSRPLRIRVQPPNCGAWKQATAWHEFEGGKRRASVWVRMSWFGSLLLFFQTGCV